MINNLKKWFIVIRAYSFVTTVVPITLGFVLAFKESNYSFPLYIYTLLGGLALHGGTNLINDYYDVVNGIDSADSHESSFYIFKKEFRLKSLRDYGITLIFIGIIIGLHLAYYRGLMVAILGLVGALGGYFYTAKPINFKYHGYGLPAVFILMGPMMVFGSYYVQTMRNNFSILWFSIPIGLLVAAILQSNDIRDIEEDKQSGIRTFSVIIGRKKSIYFFSVLIFASYFFLLLIVIFKLANPLLLLSFITIPNGIKLISSLTLRDKTSTEGKELYIVPLTAKYYGQFGLALIILLAI